MAAVVLSRDAFSVASKGGWSLGPIRSQWLIGTVKSVHRRRRRCDVTAPLASRSEQIADEGDDNDGGDDGDDDDEIVEKSRNRDFYECITHVRVPKIYHTHFTDLIFVHVFSDLFFIFHFSKNRFRAVVCYLQLEFVPTVID